MRLGLCLGERGYAEGYGNTMWLVDTDAVSALQKLAELRVASPGHFSHQ